MTPTYVPLRVHTAYSLSEGAIRIPDLAAHLAQAGIAACGITDTNTLAGTVEACAKLAAKGVQPVMGVEQTFVHGEERFPLVLLVLDAAGWRNLVRLVSDAAISGKPGMPELRLAGLRGRTDGLFCLSGGLRGPIDRALLAGDPVLAERRARSLADLFPGRFALEISRMGTPAEAQREPGLLALAEATGLPLAATNEAYFLTPDMHEAHDALLCVAHGTYLAEADRPRVSPESWLKGPAEMAALFADLPEALENTVAIARLSTWRFEKQKPMLPRFPGLPDGIGEDAHLAALAAEGLERRLASVEPAAPRSAYAERLAYECGVISKMGFAGYFLIVADFIGWAKANGIAVGPGRGSGAGSLVAWALGITNLDPIRYGLLFERFLNPDRVSMPDFDVDFCQKRRHEVIDYVRARYGEARVVHIGTYGKLQARAAVKDVGRVQQIPYPVADRWSRMIPNNPANPVTLTQAMEMSPLKEELEAADPSIRSMFATAVRLEGLYRNASTHAAGVVIASEDVAGLVPLMRDPHGTLVTQFDMKAVEEAGLVKFDFLGLKTLDVIDGARALLAERGVSVDLDRVGVDDPETYQMLAEGDTFGVFQLESAGMQKAVRQIVPSRIEDIIALCALYRPGPMENIPTYARVKHGQEPAAYLHPALEEVLAETHGIIVYQEQVMEIARRLAGYSLGQADLLRRAMGKKIKAEMDAQRRIFEEGAARQGIDAATASAIFDLLAKFADYGFNKSHAAAYAVLSFQTAWLKRHHREAFMAASMNLDMGQVEKLAEFHREARERGVRCLGPDVQRSRALFSLEDTPRGLAIRWGLAGIRGVGQEVMERLVAEREANGPFASIDDLVRRCLPGGLNRKILESLAKSGALDSLSPHRAAALAAAEEALKRHQADQKAADSGQDSLLGLLGLAAPPPPKVAAWGKDELLQGELETLGFFFSGHPLDGIRRDLRRMRGHHWIQEIQQAEEAPRGDCVVGAITLKIAFKTSRARKPMAVAKVSDPTGMLELVVFDSDVVRLKPFLEAGQPLLWTLQVSDRDGERRIFVRDAKPLPADLMEEAKRRLAA
jgi:DNA polymerase-3 subunit alpha